MPQIDLGQVVGPQGVQGEPGPQGAQGIQGPAGPAATINGVNALTIEAGDNIELSQSGSTTTLSVPTDAAPTEDSTKPVQSGGVAAALSNKAPAGYGLGAAAAPVTDLNQAVLSGWYSCAGSSNGPSSNFYGWLLVSSRTGAGGMIRQDAWNALGQPDHFVRYAVDGVWTPWEYVNPPMKIGVEYRTTERYSGKPVYAKAVNIGKLFSSYDSKEVDHGVSDMEACIECKGLVGQQNLIPNKDVTSVTVDSTTIVIEHNGFSGQPEAVVIIKYTKSTD